MNARRVLAALVFVLATAGAALAGPGAQDGCGICHGKERVQFESSVHRSADFGCVTCHGGDPAAVDSKEAAHAASKGYRGAPARRDVADACGSCHADVRRMRPFSLRTDALAAYRTSHHGVAMLEKGLADAATCSDCHGVHDVLRVSDPKSPSHRVNVPATCGRCHGDAAMMKRHGIETHAVADFAESVHGAKLARGERGVPSCADCHDAHAATPPGANEVADVCGNCHRETRDRFRESPHAAASARGAMRQCVTCHGNHSVGHPDYALFDAPDAADGGADGNAKKDAANDRGGTRCLSCHDASKPDDRGAEVAKRFGADLRASESELDAADLRVDLLSADGFHVADERAALGRARRELAAAVPLTHAVDVPRVEGALRHVRSLVHEALAGCDGKVREARDRRIFGSAAGLVLLVASAFLVLRGRGARR